MGLFSSSSKNKTTKEGSNSGNQGDYGQQWGGLNTSTTLGRGANDNRSVWADDGATLTNSVTYNLTDDGATKNAMNAVTQTTRDALGSNEATARAALGSNEATALNAMVVADRAVEQAAKLAAENTRAMQKAMAQAAKANAQSNANMANLSRYGMDSMGSLAGQSLSRYESLAGAAFTEINRANTLSQQGTEKAMDYVFKSTQSAEERQGETLVKYGTWGAVAVAALLMLMVMKGGR